MLQSHKNYNHVLTNLQDYMLTDETILSALKDKVKKVPTARVNVSCSVKEVMADIFYPKQKDTLFWCFYIIKHGFTAYEMLGNTHFIVEKQEKIKYVEELRKNKALLKSSQIKPLSDIEDELVNKEKIGPKTFMALSLLEGFHIFYIHKKKFFEFINGDDKNIHVIHCTGQHYQQVFGYEHTVPTKIIESYRDTLFHYDNLEKPIKAISNYKVSELIDICKKLGLDNKVGQEGPPLAKKSKKDLYELIMSHI